MRKLILFNVGFAFSAFSALAQPGNLPKIASTGFSTDTINIISYGAKADGITLNTKTINDAILAANKRGGAVVMIPPGLWMTGPIVLRSNVNLFLAENALLLFTNDFSQYQLVATNWEGQPAARNQSPISAENETNIAITGKGIIDGNGDAWRMVKRDKLTETQWKKKIADGGLLSQDKKTWFPTASSLLGSTTEKPGVLLDGKKISDYNSIKDYLRPNLLVFANCDKVLLEGVSFQNSPAWCLHPLMCTNLTIKDITVRNPWYAQNGDGIDIESCKNVLLENSSFDVGDDGICIKSGRDAEGRKRGIPTENVVINDCTVYHAHGGFVIGSEMSGGAKNIYVNNCSFIGTDIGLRFKTTRGRGGIVENIFVNNIVMKDIVGEAILFDMYYAAKDPILLAGEVRVSPKVELFPVTEATPQFRNFYINNVVCNGAEKALFIRGLPEMNIHDISLNNIQIVSRKGIEISEAKKINFENTELTITGTDPATDILNSGNIHFNNSYLRTTAPTLLRIGGERSEDIFWNNSSSVKDKTVFEFGAKPAVLKIN